MLNGFESHAPEGPLHRPVGGGEDAVPAALEVVEEYTPVEGLGGGPLEPYAERVGYGAIGAKADHVPAVEEAERRPPGGSLLATQPAREVACSPRSLLHCDGGRGRQRAVAGIFVEPRVPEDVDVSPVWQGEVRVYPDPSARVVFSREAPDEVRDLYASRPDADARRQPDVPGSKALLVRLLDGRVQAHL